MKRYIIVLLKLKEVLKLINKNSSIFVAYGGMVGSSLVRV